LRGLQSDVFWLRAVGAFFIQRYVPVFAMAHAVTGKIPENPIPRKQA